MKKTHKKVLGLVGLSIVAAVTVFAASLPVPQMRASAATEVTDTLVVEVVGEEPYVKVTGMPDGSIETTSEQKIGVDYQSTDDVSVSIKYTDTEGNEYPTEQIVHIDPNYCPGSLSVDIDFTTGEYSYTYEYLDEHGEKQTVTVTDQHLTNFGYGSYTITANGEDSSTGEQADPSSSSFAILPAYGEVGHETAPDGTETNYVNVYYSPDGAGGEVSEIEVIVYDKDGNELFRVGPVPASDDGRSKIILPFADYDLDEGEYTIGIVSYDGEGNQLAEPYTIAVSYNPEEDIVVPSTADTGGLFRNLNISRSDYLLTGLITFSIIAVVATAIITRNNRQKATAKRGVRVASRSTKSLKASAKTRKSTKSNRRK